MERLFLERNTLGEIRDSLGFCCGEISNNWFAGGNDSLAYRWGDRVIKVYKSDEWKNLSSQEKNQIVQSYVDITNRASLLAEQENWQIKLPVNKLILPVRIVPVLRVLNCSCCGTPATVSGFVEGANLEEITPKDREELPFDVKELPTALALFSLSLYEKLGYYGISVIPKNVKLQSGILVVTDLCADLLSLGKKPSI